MNNHINAAHVGLHVAAKRKLAGVIYWHHGILVGEGSVIHYTSSPFRGNGEVKRVRLRTFAGGRRVYVIPSEADRPDLVLQRAFSKLGESKYCLATNNCEHFAYYCRSGKGESGQVKNVFSLAADVILSSFYFPAAAVSAAITVYDLFQLESKLTPLSKYQGNGKPGSS